LKKYLVPAIEHIIKIVENFEGSTSCDVPFVYDIEDHLNTMVSEAMLSFFIYGSAISTSQRKGHCNDILQDIGMTASAMKDSDFFTAFKQLDVSHNTIKYNPSKPIRKLFPNNLEFCQIVHELWVEEEEFIHSGQSNTSPRNNAIKFLVDCIIKTANLSLGKSDSTLLKTTEVLAIRYNSCRVQSCEEFISWLFTANGRQKYTAQLQNLMSVLNKCVHDKKDWMSHVWKALEARMMKESSFLNYVFDKETAKVVIPFTAIMRHDSNSLACVDILQRCFIQRFNNKPSCDARLARHV